MRKVGFFFICCVLFCLLVGCAMSRPLPTTTEPSVKIEYRDRVKVDSVVSIDSVIIREKGDTIYIREVKVSRETLRDTIQVCKIDTIRVPMFIEKEVEVERQLTTYERIKITIGGWLIAFVIIMLISYFVKKYLKR